jgi:hypothetical protein
MVKRYHGGGGYWWRTPTSQVPGCLREAEIDSLINHTDEGSPDEGDFQAILEDLQEALTTTYSMMATANVVQNVTCPKIPLVLSRDGEGYLDKILNPHQDRRVSGCQLYMPLTRYMFREDVQTNSHLLRRLPTLVMDQLTNNEIHNGRGLQLIRNQALSVLEMLERKAYHAVEQAKNQTSGHVRFEAFFDITDSRDCEWPEQNVLQPIKMFTNDNFYQFLVEMCASSLGPLHHFIKQECDRNPEDPNPNMSIIPAAAKTCLFACAELSILLVCPSRYTPQVFDQCLQAAVAQQDGGHRSAVPEIPLSQQVEILPQAKSWTGLQYGIDPKLLKYCSTQIVLSPLSQPGVNASPLSRIIASRIKKDVVLQLSFVDCVARTKRIILNLQLTAAAASAPDIDMEEAVAADALNDPVPFFEEVNYAQLCQELEEEERKELYSDMAKLLIGLYNEEYHYYYMKNKKIRANDAITSYPRVKKTIQDMPCTMEQLVLFKQAEQSADGVISADHIRLPCRADPIRTESE